MTYLLVTALGLSLVFKVVLFEILEDLGVELGTFEHLTKDSKKKSQINK